MDYKIKHNIFFCFICSLFLLLLEIWDKLARSLLIKNFYFELKQIGFLNLKNKKEFKQKKKTIILTLIIIIIMWREKKCNLILSFYIKKLNKCIWLNRPKRNFYLLTIKKNIFNNIMMKNSACLYLKVFLCTVKVFHFNIFSNQSLNIITSSLSIYIYFFIQFKQSYWSQITKNFERSFVKVLRVIWT